MRKIAALLLFACLATALAAPAEGGLFLRGSYGWMEGEVYRTDVAGSPYNGGPGGSVEVGIDLSRSVALSLEYGPSHVQQVRAIPSASDLEDGSYRLAMVNLLFRTEPIETIRPYLHLGGGQAVFTFDYGEAGKVFGIGGVDRRLHDERLTGWILGGGFGFEAPAFSAIFWGVRGRYLWHRWQADTDAGRFLPFDSGNGYTLAATLALRP